VVQGSSQEPSWPRPSNGWGWEGGVGGGLPNLGGRNEGMTGGRGKRRSIVVRKFDKGMFVTPNAPRSKKKNNQNKQKNNKKGGSGSFGRKPGTRIRGQKNVTAILPRATTKSDAAIGDRGSRKERDGLHMVIKKRNGRETHVRGKGGQKKKTWTHRSTTQKTAGRRKETAQRVPIKRPSIQRKTRSRADTILRLGGIEMPSARQRCKCKHRVLFQNTQEFNIIGRWGKISGLNEKIGGGDSVVKTKNVQMGSGKGGGSGTVHTKPQA